MFRLGIDIGGTKVAIGLLNENQNIVIKHTEKIPDNKDFSHFLDWLSEILDALLTDNGISRIDILTCGIGVPGTVSADGKTALKVPNIGWVNASVAYEFERRTGIPTILVQDSRAAAFGEYIAGSGRGKQIVVCVTLGTGIGTGIVINGRIFDGALGGAGELGHIPAVPNGRQCGCGKKGCLENYAAGKGLGITVKEIFGDSYTPGDIFEQAKCGNESAVRILDEAIVMLGNAMVSIINLLSPDCLLFSGGMSRQTELLINPLIRYIKEHSYSVSVGENLYIGLAGLGEDSPLVGAALLPHPAIPKKPKFIRLHYVRRYAAFGKRASTPGGSQNRLSALRYHGRSFCAESDAADGDA